MFFVADFLRPTKRDVVERHTTPKSTQGNRKQVVSPVTPRDLSLQPPRDECSGPGRCTDLTVMRAIFSSTTYCGASLPKVRFGEKFLRTDGSPRVRDQPALLGLWNGDDGCGSNGRPDHQPGFTPSCDRGDAKRHCDGAGREFSVAGCADREWHRSAHDGSELHDACRKYQRVTTCTAGSGAVAGEEF